jgi:hypothetical protein
MQQKCAGLSRACYQFRRERSVAIVSERQAGLFIDQACARQLGSQTFRHHFVFFRFKAAGAVDERASGLQQTGDAMSNLQLLLLHSVKLVTLQPPANINSSPDHSRVRTWRVNQNPVKTAGSFSFQIAW